MESNKYMKEMEELKILREKVEKSLLNAPKGRIRAEMKNGKYPQYYLFDKENEEISTRGRYLRKNELELARACVQKEYDKRVLNAISKREKTINEILLLKGEEEIKNIHKKMPEAKRILIVPYVISDEEYVNYWLKSNGENENTISIVNGFVTEQGEIVRSKSEKMIADKLYFRKIPYKYEKSLKLSGRKMIFPDFTLLNVRKREEIYLEHFGMMDNPEYCKKALEKIDLYEENGIYLGERLFVTFESSMKAINLQSIDNIIDINLLV